MPKLNKKRQDKTETEKRKLLKEVVSDKIRVTELTEGNRCIGICMGNKFTDEERSLIPKNLCPWVWLECEGQKRFMAFAHYDKVHDEEGEGFKLSHKKNTDKGLVIFLLREDGKGWPEEDNQSAIVLPFSPEDILGTDLGVSVIKGILKDLLNITEVDAFEIMERG